MVVPSNVKRASSGRFALMSMAGMLRVRFARGNALSGTCYKNFFWKTAYFTRCRWGN
jgi:hypothetical protein